MAAIEQQYAGFEILQPMGFSIVPPGSDIPSDALNAIEYDEFTIVYHELEQQEDDHGTANIGTD